MMVVMHRCTVWVHMPVHVHVVAHVTTSIPGRRHRLARLNESHVYLGSRLRRVSTSADTGSSLVVQGVLWGTEGAWGALIDAIARKGSSLSGELVWVGLICQLDRFLGSTGF